MATSHIIFVNPDTGSKLYTLFNGMGDTQSTVSTKANEISLAELKTEVNGVVGDATQIYVVHPKFVSGVEDDQIEHLEDYLATLFSNDIIDIFYLSNFMDNCVNRAIIPSAAGYLRPSSTNHPSIANYTFQYSVSPNGLGCVCATKAGWTSIIALAEDRSETNLSARITALIEKESVTAGTSQPLFVFPDINKHTESIEALQTQYCRIEKNFGKPINAAKENLSFVWFVAGVSISIIIAWIFAFYTPSLNKLKMKL